MDKYFTGGGDENFDFLIRGMIFEKIEFPY